MIPANSSRIIILEPYMEVIGILDELVDEGEMILVEIANHTVLLPADMKEALMIHIGHRVALLRTDIPGKEYLFRVIADKEKTALMCEKARAPESCEASA